MTDYGVIYEQASDGSWSARVADLPVYAVGDTRQEAEREIHSALGLYLEELARAGETAPAPRSIFGVVTM